MRRVQVDGVLGQQLELVRAQVLDEQLVLVLEREQVQVQL